MSESLVPAVVVRAAVAAGVQGVRQRGPAGDRWLHPETGNLHRLGGPAVSQGDARVWYVNGFRHREDGPAEVTSKYGQWWLYGEPHRVDGPALQYVDGRREWGVRSQLVEDAADQEELSRLYDAGELERLEMVLTIWHPDGPSVVELSAAIAAATT